MSEGKIFCSVIIFILGIYTIVLLQYELFKLSNLNSGSNVVGREVVARAKKGSVSSKGSNLDVVEIKDVRPLCNSTFKKIEFSLGRLNCGSAGDLLDLVVENCTELPCDIHHNVNYSVVLHFAPSRDISKLQIETSVRQKKMLKYLHKETAYVKAKEGETTTIKFSFLLPPHAMFRSRKKLQKCTTQGLYLLGVEIWDVPSGIGELCLMIPMLVYLF